MESQRVVVTTEHRGVFFGTLKSRADREVVLMDARCCVYWAAQTKGFLGLAKTGPLNGSRVTPAVPELMLTDVTSIALCTPEAATRWESGPWN